MDSIAEPARETPDLVVPEWVQAQISALQFQLAERDAELKRRAVDDAKARHGAHRGPRPLYPPLAQCAGTATPHWHSHRG